MITEQAVSELFIIFMDTIQQVFCLFLPLWIFIIVVVAIKAIIKQITKWYSAITKG